MNKLIEAYHSNFNDEIKGRLDKIYNCMVTVLDSYDIEYEEKISYQMPTFKYKRNLIHYAAFKTHIGLYPGALAIEVFANDLEGYHTTKGAIWLDYNKDIPFKLIEDILRYRISIETK